MSNKDNSEKDVVLNIPHDRLLELAYLYMSLNNGTSLQTALGQVAYNLKEAEEYLTAYRGDSVFNEILERKRKGLEFHADRSSDEQCEVKYTFRDFCDGRIFSKPGNKQDANSMHTPIAELRGLITTLHRITNEMNERYKVYLKPNSAFDPVQSLIGKCISGYLNKIRQLKDSLDDIDRGRGKEKVFSDHHKHRIEEAKVYAKPNYEIPSREELGAWYKSMMQ